MQFNPVQRELTLKVVYYGPALSGKTTNLHALHAAMDERSRGRLMTLDTADDRTLFFDMLPVFVTSATGVRLKVKLFTVPGQVMHDSTRRIVLSGADAVAFIADAQPEARRANFEYWKNLQVNLRENGLVPAELPVVIQFNKCDLASDSMRREIREVGLTAREPVTLATAVRGEGVVETFQTLLSRTFDELDKRHGLQRILGIDHDEFMATLNSTLRRPAGHRSTGHRTAGHRPEKTAAGQLLGVGGTTPRPERS